MRTERRRMVQAFTGAARKVALELCAEIIKRTGFSRYREQSAALPNSGGNTDKKFALRLSQGEFLSLPSSRFVFYGYGHRITD